MGSRSSFVLIATQSTLAVSSFAHLKAKSFWDSNAVIRIAKNLTCSVSLIGHLGQIVPGPIRDIIYNYVSKNQYRLGGEYDCCRLDFDGMGVGADAPENFSYYPLHVARSYYLPVNATREAVNQSIKGRTNIRRVSESPCKCEKDTDTDTRATDKKALPLSTVHYGKGH